MTGTAQPDHCQTIRPRAWLAGFLSLLVAGLGHLYVGKPRTASILFAAEVLVFGLTIVWQLGLPSRFWMLAASVTLVALLYLYAVTDSVIHARRVKEHRRAAYNRWYLYLAIAAAFWIVQLASQSYLQTTGRFHAAELHSATTSMEPSIRQGERFLVDYSYYQNKQPQRGDVAVYSDPQDAKRVLIRRVVAVAGERVSMQAGRLSINGQPVEETYAKLGTRGDASITETTVPAGSVFVLPDNRSIASTRYNNLVPTSRLVGRATEIGFSTDFARMGRWIGTPHEF